MAATRVSVAFIHPGEVAGAFASSLADTLLADRGPRRIRNVVNMEASPRIAEARTKMVEVFLADDRNEWLFMVDADMSWEPLAFNLIVVAAHEQRVPIIGGLCFAGGRSRGEDGVPRSIPPCTATCNPRASPSGSSRSTSTPPTGWSRSGRPERRSCWCTDSCSRPSRRSSPTAPTGTRTPTRGSLETVTRGRAVGEDITFCMRASACGFPVHVHTGAKVAHRKHIDLTEDLWLRQEAP